MDATTEELTDCATCAHGREHGWWGNLGGKVHCPQCHATTSGKRPHCCGCHRTFTTERAADRHRVTVEGERRCGDPATLTDKEGRPRLVRRPDGLWGTPPPADRPAWWAQRSR